MNAFSINCYTTEQKFHDRNYETKRAYLIVRCFINQYKLLDVSQLACGATELIRRASCSRIEYAV